jgi:2-oxoglutarate ferredoxin oxidoreductase subunit delta
MSINNCRAQNPPTRAPEAILVDLELCKACGICIELCPEHVFDRDDLGQPVVARLADCTVCAFCERHCPDFAVDIVRPAGKA